MNATQKITAAAMALIITVTGAIGVTAPVTLPGISPASSHCNSCWAMGRDIHGPPK